MASAVVAPVPNENRSVASRMTKEGRRITYVLQVIQKPERARACGQGAKSSSDRRPVDPPPIVDLHVFEGDERDGRDITFTYNANFFLFATLENARPIAHGRIPAAQQNSPVLTGTPVAGMAYLDRPQPAGYFIFPDLSVRHEGKYRLAFTLFEDVKDPKDADSYQQGSGVQVHGRCEVKSSPFTVFSAKKFPGLTESTQLSRTVADQGCRVRIRRDVRMRRRNDKDSKEWDSYEDATAEQRANRSSTPESHAQHQLLAQNQQPIDSTDRSRSMSNASNASNHPMQPSRRTSAQDLQQSYQAGYMGHPVDVAAPQSQTQQPSTPHPAQHAVAAFVPPATISAPPPSSTIAPQPHISQSPQASAGYVQQGTYDQTHMAQYPPSYPPQHYVPTQPMAAYQQPQEYPFGGAPNASMPPTPQVQVQHQQPHPTGAQQQIQAMGPPSYGYMQQPAVYESSVPQVRPQESMECISQQRTNHASYNRGSVSSQYSASSHPISPLTQEDGGFARTPMSSMGMFNSASAGIAHGKDLPPLQVLESAPHKTEMSSPMTSGGFEAGARPTPPGTFSRGTAGKRSYGSTFNTQHIQEPLRAGARPNTVAGTVSMDASDGSDEDIDFEAFKLSYRRADGNRVQKVWSQSAL